MAAKRHSLAWKIAAANTLLAVFAVLMVVALENRSDRRLLEATIRRELTQAVAAGVLSLEQTDSDASGLRERDQLELRLRSLQSTNPAVARMYVLARDPNGDPHLLAGSGVSAAATLSPAVWASVASSLDRGVPVSTGVYRDSDGQWLSAFQPIRNRQG